MPSFQKYYFIILTLNICLKTCDLHMSASVRILRELVIPRRSSKRLREFPSGTRAFSGRGSAGFRGEIAQWLKTTVVYQSYLGGHAVTNRPSIPCRRLPSRFFDTDFFLSSPLGMVSAGARFLLIT